MTDNEHGPCDVLERAYIICPGPRNHHHLRFKTLSVVTFMSTSTPTSHSKVSRPISCATQPKHADSNNPARAYVKAIQLSEGCCSNDELLEAILVGGRARGGLIRTSRPLVVGTRCSSINLWLTGAAL